ncbi:MAG TPA: flagellar biosynthesis protein FlhB [Thermodesulfovibrionales bacterium]|nr:flagellar biosynthesis protein FlhB [Thermodesulfovibrionales bacterium]
MAEFEEKTEQATPRRRQKAREEGQVARSRELISMSATAGILLMFYFAGAAFVGRIGDMMKRLLTVQYGRNPVDAMKFASVEMLWILVPFLGISFIVALASGAMQGGFVIKPVKFEFGKLNPLNGFKQLFSKYGLVEFLKSLLKFVIGGAIFYLILRNVIDIMPSTATMDVRDMLTFSGKLLFKSILTIYFTFFVFAVIDYFYQRWRLSESLKMTKEEIKQEYKETEGDPMVKSRIKSIQREMARRRMMQEVPKASVVITNPTHIAVALRYEKDEMAAPVLIAKGAEFAAEKIKEIARKHRIPIVEDKPLARTIFKLQLNSSIPPELYRAVAKILAYIYKLRGAA